MSETLPEVSTPRDLARHWQLPLKTVYRLTAQEGGIPSMRVGRHLRYRRDECERWLQAQRNTHGDQLA